MLNESRLNQANYSTYERYGNISCSLGLNSGGAIHIVRYSEQRVRDRLLISNALENLSMSIAEQDTAERDRQPHGRRIAVTVHIAGHGVQTFEFREQGSLLELLETAAKLAGFALLPLRQQPFDRLHAMHGEQVVAVIENLDQTLAHYLHQANHLPHFTVELAPAIHVNTRWDEAPSEQMSPREILVLPASTSIIRNTRCTGPRVPNRCRSIRPSLWNAGRTWRCSATANTAEAANVSPEAAVDEVQELVRAGMAVELVEHNGLSYAHVPRIEVPVPPWSKAAFDILIAIPAAYNTAQLDGFYVEQPCVYNGGEHPRIQGDVIELLDRKWRLISWHYPDDKPWVPGKDSLETHIVHCRGFFLHRGAVNAR